MAVTYPFLSAYDPPGTSEGTLDPLGLYQIADQLAMQLVPAVRERMLRIRFLTAMAVGAMVTEGMDDDMRTRDASPCLIWEWLVVEAMVRRASDDGSIWGVPGTLVARRAIQQRDYVDARSYLKTPRIFGFHGVYKRLAVRLGLANVHLGLGPNSEALIDAWAKDNGFRGLNEIKPLVSNWSNVVRRSQIERPPRTKANWNNERWTELADAFAPGEAKAGEKQLLKEMLLASGEQCLGALPALWKLQTEFDESEFGEELLHERLGEREPAFRPLLKAIRSYETFARSLQDAFDVLRVEAGHADCQGFEIGAIGSNSDFKLSVQGLPQEFAEALHALSAIVVPSISLTNLFSERFGDFSEPLDPVDCASSICVRHEDAQKAKGDKRPWFDRLAHNRIYIRHPYRIPKQRLENGQYPIKPGSYVHAYRGWPIRRFQEDLA